MRHLAAFALVAALSGCAITTSVKPVASAPADAVCIEMNRDVLVPDLLGVIEAGFKRNGYATQVVDQSPAQCPVRVTYTASRRWDGVSFLSDADISMFRDRELIGQATYQLPAGVFGGGGANPNKWKSTAFKIDPLLDQMLAVVKP